MASGIFDDALIKHLWSSDECRAIFNDENRVRKWYEFEAALAIEQAAMGIIPQAVADEIVARAKDAKIDIEAIGAEIRRIKHPLVPALKALQAQCKGDLGEYIHFGPTTQDVLDTGTVLQMRDIHAIYLRDIKAIGKDLLRLSKSHRATPMVGRTHGVQALPITFGHKCAIWLSEMGRHYERLRELEKRVFVGGMVGAVGTMASYGAKARELEKRLMKRLGLGVADINWQPARDRFAEYVCVLGMLGQTLNKIANEIYVLEHTEIGELYEPFSDGKLGNQYIECTTGCPASTANRPTIDNNFIPGAFYFDVGGTYNVTKAVTAYFKVDNVFNRDPARSPYFVNPALYDVLGRVYRAGVRFNF